METPSDMSNTPAGSWTESYPGLRELQLGSDEESLTAVDVGLELK